MQFATIEAYPWHSKMSVGGQAAAQEQADLNRRVLGIATNTVTVSSRNREKIDHYGGKGRFAASCVSFLAYWSPKACGRCLIVYECPI